MSIQLIQQYDNKVEKIIQYGESRNEASLRKPFQDLLACYARGLGEYRIVASSTQEGVLERYKEKNPKDPMIAEKFNTYRFAGYKKGVIGLLGRKCRVSVELMRMVREMENVET